MSLRPEAERKAQQNAKRPSSLLERARALAPLVERDAELAHSLTDACRRLHPLGPFLPELPLEHLPQATHREGGFTGRRDSDLQRAPYRTY